MKLENSQDNRDFRSLFLMVRPGFLILGFENTSHSICQNFPCTYKVVAAATAAKSLQSYPTLCDPIDGSPPGSPVPGILQARTLEWVAISFSTGRYLDGSYQRLAGSSLSEPPVKNSF